MKLSFLISESLSILSEEKYLYVFYSVLVTIISRQVHNNLLSLVWHKASSMGEPSVMFTWLAR